MTAKISAKSRILKEMHETAQDMLESGIISDNEMLEFDALCLEEIPNYTPDLIAGLRAKWNLTQAAFANVINASISTVQKWETGVKKPSGPSRKLLHILETKGLHALL